MGRLAMLAQEHYEKLLPKTYAGLTDPETFFRNLETEAEQQIDDLTDRFADVDLNPAETFEEKVGRLKNARQRAEEIVLRETVLIDPATVETETDSQETDYPSTTDLATPEDRELASAMADFQEATEELAEIRSSSQPPQSQSASPMPDSPPTE